MSSGKSSFISRFSPLRILSTNLPGIGGKARKRIRVGGFGADPWLTREAGVNPAAGKMGAIDGNSWRGGR